MQFIILLIISFFATTTSLSAAETQTFSCEYPIFSDQEGSHKEKEPFKFSIILDSDTRKAYLVGNNGAGEVIYRPNADVLTFIEETTSGNLNVTVIAKDGVSVHSRHPYFVNRFIASQYYGKCVKK
jgi:hypothetical protein